MKTRVLALVLVTLCSILLANPVYADSVNRDPQEGPVGTEVTVTGLTPDETYTLKWDGADVEEGDVPSSGEVIFVVPEATAGSHTIGVENPSGVTVAGSPFAFLILPSIVLSANAEAVGGNLTINGYGFASNEADIKVTYDSDEIKKGIAANEDGSWNATFVVPSSTKGSHTVDASGESTDATGVPDIAFTVTPKITLSPTSGDAGVMASVSGTGFGEDEGDIRVTYDGVVVQTGISADSNGSWNTTFVVPSSTRGSHIVDASGLSTAASEVPDVTYSISTILRVEPTSGYVGDDIVVSGSGFGADEEGIKITLGGTVIKSGIKANHEGYWTTPLTIPPAVGGTHVVDAFGFSTIAADVSDAGLGIMIRLVLDPAEGHAGSNITVIGTAFNGDKDLTISYDGTSVADDLTTDAKGSFEVSFKAPESVGGGHEVVAVDAGGASASAVFAMETVPPPLPQVVSPKDGSRVGLFDYVTATFVWADVADPSGVSYSLEISSQPDFATTLLNKEGLTESEYTLTEAQALPRGHYYWRVKAVDGAGNDSGWTNVFLVKAGLMPLWAFILIIVAVIAFLTRLVFFLRTGKEDTIDTFRR